MKEPLILLPGMMCDARLFAAQVARFSADRAILVAPLIGQTSFAKMIEDVLSYTPPRFALAGLSMGGIAAMEIMRQAPERISRLALLDTNHLAESAERAALRDLQIERVKAGELKVIVRDEMKPNYLADGPHKSQILDLCMVMAESLGAEVFQQQSLALKSRQDYTDVLTAVDVPTLILCGEEDALCPLERHQMMQALVSNARLAVITGAGHLPTLEQSEQTNSELDQWLKT